MKKILIVLLSILLVLSFTSCEKDKSEEMLSTYEKFAAGLRIGENIHSARYDVKQVTASDYTGSILYIVRDIVKDLYNYDETFTITGITEATGTIKNIEGYTDNYHIKYENIVISYTYTYGESSGSGKLSFSGTYSRDVEDNTKTYVYDFVVNGENYKTEYTLNNYEEFTSAKINGTDVNLSLLNARIKI